MQDWTKWPDNYVAYRCNYVMFDFNNHFTFIRRNYLRIRIDRFFYLACWYVADRQFLLTALAGMEMRSVVYVRLSVFFHFCLLNRLTFDLVFCMCITLDRSSPGIESGSQMSMQNLCATPVGYLLRVLWVLTDGHSSRFLLWCHQLRASTARRAAWRGRDHWHVRSPEHTGRGNTAGLTSIRDWW